MIKYNRDMKKAPNKNNMKEVNKMTLTKKAIKSFEAAITAARIIKQNAEKSGDTEKVQLCNQELMAYSMSLYYIGYDFYCDNYIAHVYKMEKENAE